MTQALAHRWRFFRAGGFDQVQLETPADLAALRIAMREVATRDFIRSELDRKSVV